MQLPSAFARVSNFIESLFKRKNKSAFAKDSPDPGQSLHTTLDLVRKDYKYQIITLAQDFTPEDVRGFREEAHFGNPMHLFGFYDETRRFGLTPQFEKARDMVSGADWDIRTYPEEFADENVKSDDADMAREVRQYCDDQFARLIPDVARDGATLDFYSIAAHEVKTTPRAGGVSKLTGINREAIRSIKPIPARRFRLDMETQEWLMRQEPLSFEGVPIEPFMKTGELVFMEMDTMYPIDQRGLFFPCAAVWCLANFTFTWWGNWLEGFSIPFRDITWDDTIKSDAKTEADAIINTMGANPYSSHSKAVAVDFKYALATGRITHHRDLVDWADRWYDRVIHGHSQASNVQEGAGSRTSTERADDQSIHRWGTSAQRLANHYREQILRPLIKRNYGQTIAAKFTPEITARVKTRENALEFSQAVFNMAKAGCEIIPQSEGLRALGARAARKGELTFKLPQSVGTSINMSSQTEDDDVRMLREIGIRLAKKRLGNMGMDI